MTFKKTPKQKEATELMMKSFYFMCFGGTRSGKTFNYCRNIMIRANYIQSNHLILRKYFNHVRTTVLEDTFPKMMKISAPNVPYKVNKSDSIIEFRNKSRIFFGGAENKDRVEKFLGTEYSTILANECSQLDYEMILLLAARVIENTELEKFLWMDCNPTTKKHWIYKLFVEKKCPVTGNSLEKPELYDSILMNPQDNAENLSSQYIDVILESMPQRQRDRFKYGRFLEDVEGALWDMDLIEKNRVSYTNFNELSNNVELKQIIVSVDPATTTKKDSDNTGIILTAISADNVIYVCDDFTLTPDTHKKTVGGWADTLIEVYETFGCNLIVAETNQGGDLVEDILRLKGFRGKIKTVHARIGKMARAEPIAALYEQGFVKHLSNPNLVKLEDEMMSFVPFKTTESPDRLDAAVYGIHHLSQHLPRKSSFFIRTL